MNSPLTTQDYCTVLYGPALNIENWHFFFFPAALEDIFRCEEQQQSASSTVINERRPLCEAAQMAAPWPLFVSNEETVRMNGMPLKKYQQ